MPTTVTINGVTANTPFYIFVCNDPITQCLYITEILNTPTYPIQFDIPSPYDTLGTYNIKIVDDDGCIKTQTLTV